MSYQLFYQKQYRKKNKEHIKDLKKDLYDLYKSEYIPCIFCHKLVQLNATNTHLRTKTCISIQQAIDNYVELLVQHKRKINDIKCNLRLLISDTDDIKE